MALHHDLGEQHPRQERLAGARLPEDAGAALGEPVGVEADRGLLHVQRAAHPEVVLVVLAEDRLDLLRRAVASRGEVGRDGLRGKWPVVEPRGAGLGEVGDDVDEAEGVGAADHGANEVVVHVGRGQHHGGVGLPQRNVGDDAEEAPALGLDGDETPHRDLFNGDASFEAHVDALGQRPSHDHAEWVAAGRRHGSGGVRPIGRREGVVGRHGAHCTRAVRSAEQAAVD